MYLRSHSWDVMEPWSNLGSLDSELEFEPLCWSTFLTFPISEGKTYRAVECDSAMESEDWIQMLALTPALCAVGATPLASLSFISLSV